METQIELVRDVLLKMDASEVRTLVNYLQIAKRGSKLKTVRFVELILSKRTYNASTIQNKLGYKGNDSAFKSFIKFFREKMCYSLTLDVNVVRPEVWSNLFQQEIKCRNRISQARILISKGCEAEALAILRRVINVANKYDLFVAGYEAAWNLQELTLIREGIKAAKIWEAQMQNYQQASKIEAEAKKEFYHLQIEEEFRSDDETFPAKFKQRLDKLEAEFSKSKIAIVGYYYMYLLQGFYAKTKMFKEAEGTCESLTKHLKDNVSIYMPRRVGLIYLKQARMRVLQGKMTEALISSSSCIRHSTANPHNVAEAYTICCYAYIYSYDFEKAKENINAALDITTQIGHKNEIWYAQRMYLKGCAYFLSGNYYRAHLALQKPTKPLDADEVGYKVAIQILIIMNQISWGGLNHPSEVFIENLDAYIRRNANRFEFTPRFLIIVKVLQALAKTNFDFDLVQDSHSKQLELLSPGNLGLRWHYLAPEVIRFDNWFASMVEKRPYRLVV